MELRLRQYQEDFLGKLKLKLKQNRNILSVLPCGAGKTVLFAYIADNHIKLNPKNEVWFIVHRKELIDQTIDTFNTFGINSERIKIFMVQSLSNMIKKDKINGEPTMIIFDECFPGNTKVDGKCIKDLKIGDYVKSWNEKTNTIEYKKIIHIFKRKPSSMCAIKLSNGKVINCTHNHPIYVENKGYINAIDIKEGDYVREISMHNLWKNPRRKGLHKESMEMETTKIQANEKSILFNRLLKKISFKNSINYHAQYQFEKQGCNSKQNENKESNEQDRNKRKSIHFFERYAPQTTNSRWKWENITVTTNNNDGEIEGIQSSIRVCNTNRNKKKQQSNEIPNLLQDRYCTRKTKTSNRDRWGFTSSIKDSKGGQEERRIFEKVRVESIEIIKQTSDGTYGGLCEDGYVYNLEVEDNHNYFANDILVHNCHHSTSTSWLTIINTYPNAYKIGLTATPCRLDGVGLKNVFDEMLVGVNAKYLIQHKYLAPYDYYAPRLAIEGLNLKVKGSDYDSTYVTEMFEKSKIYGDVVSNYIKLANGKKSILYAPSIEFSNKICQEFQDNGINAVHFDGNTPKKERDEIIEKFRKGKIEILCNVDLVGEGFNVPDCECCLLLRPTMSVALYIQQSMRCMRYKENKKAIIIDYVGNCFRHGLPDDDREWTLDGKMRCLNESAEKDIVSRECGKCHRVYSGIAPICPYCGNDNHKTRKQIEQEEKAELERITEIEKRNAKREVGMARSFDSLVEIGRQRGYANPHYWARCVWNSRELKKLRK